eukprot:scaffold69485_cov63-Phaeocystis_antarctica.AAC.1
MQQTMKERSMDCYVVGAANAGTSSLLTRCLHPDPNPNPKPDPNPSPNPNLDPNLDPSPNPSTLTRTLTLTRQELLPQPLPQPLLRQEGHGQRATAGQCQQEPAGPTDHQPPAGDDLGLRARLAALAAPGHLRHAWAHHPLAGIRHAACGMRHAAYGTRTRTRTGTRTGTGTTAHPATPRTTAHRTTPRTPPPHAPQLTTLLTTAELSDTVPKKQTDVVTLRLAEGKA